MNSSITNYSPGSRKPQRNQFPWVALLRHFREQTPRMSLKATLVTTIKNPSYHAPYFSSGLRTALLGDHIT